MSELGRYILLYTAGVVIALVLAAGVAFLWQMWLIGTAL